MKGYVWVSGEIKNMIYDSIVACSLILWKSRIKNA